jgi:hypothetical protein
MKKEKFNSNNKIKMKKINSEIRLLTIKKLYFFKLNINFIDFK